MKKEQKEIIIVKNKHIRAGIQKYNGKIDRHVQQLFAYAGVVCDPYLFDDGRILIVYEDVQNAILYLSKDILFSKVVFENTD